MKKIVLSLITLLLALAGSAAPVGRRAALEQYKARLAKASSPADSVDILYNIFDLSRRREQPDVARLLLSVAGRAHDYAAQNDMIRQLAVALSGDENQMIQLRSRAAVIPNSVDKHITTMFLNHQLLTSQLQSWSEDERKARLVEIIAKWKQGEGEDIFDRIDRLYTISAITGNATQGQLYMESLETMNRLIDSLPAEAWPLRNQCFTALANIYSNTDRYDLAIEADRRLLDVIDKLEADFHKSGRPYRSYDLHKYYSYRRMLSNYRALSQKEIEDTYHKIEALAARDEDVAETHSRYVRSRVYYLMGTKRYQEAIPLILQMLSEPDLRLNYRRQALRELRVAATVTGNDEVLLRALREYVDIIDRYDSLRIADNLNELAVRFEVSQLRNENIRLLSQARASDISHEREMQIYYIFAIFILLAFLTFFIVRYYSLQRKKRG